MAISTEMTETSAEVTHGRLRDAILSGELRPNERLVEEDLAAELGVSRTPVREALLRLRQEGLVTQRKGWFVRDHKPSEVLEFLEARAMLESAAARLAAKRISEEALGEVRGLLEQMEHTENRREANALNTRFHAMITDAAGNGPLATFARATNINYWTFSTPVIFTEADDAHVSSDHRELYEALARRDADEAGRIARVHVERTADILARSLGLEPRGEI